MKDPSLTDKTFLCGVAVSVYQNSGTGWVTCSRKWLKPALKPVMCCQVGDKKAQWANFEKKKLLPFNFRVQLSGSDLKNEVKEVTASDNSKEETDHDIQQLVAEEDKETKKYKEKSAGDSKFTPNIDAASNHLDSKNEHADDEHEEEEKRKKKAQIEYQIRSEGVRIGESSDFWNNYKLDIGLAEELGEQALLLFKASM